LPLLTPRPDRGKIMKNKRIYTTLLLLAFGLLLVPLASAIEEEVPVQRYVFNIPPEKMLGVTMSYSDPLHKLHVNAMEEAGKDCTVCHFANDETRFMNASPNDKDMLSVDARMDFIHDSCASCHAEMQAGPSITSCRTCHNEQYDAETGLERVMR